jgi:hypothetical protein
MVERAQRQRALRVEFLADVQNELRASAQARLGRTHGSFACLLVPACLLAVCVASSACGSAAANVRRTFVAAGQLPPWDRPTSHDLREVKLSETTTTIPLAKQNPLSALFQSMDIFQSCLQGLGTPFIGVPSKSDPNSPANDPTYVKNLQTCAAKSQIVQALKDIQNAENHLTPAQIRTQNKQFLAWRKCMIGRGWQIPTPTPDSSGRLFDISQESTSQWVPPPGQSLLNSPDMQACANKVAGNALHGGG